MRRRRVGMGGGSVWRDKECVFNIRWTATATVVALVFVAAMNRCSPVARATSQFRKLLSIEGRPTVFTYDEEKDREVIEHTFTLMGSRIRQLW